MSRWPSRGRRGGREMAEETGLSARKLVPLGYFYPSPGVLDEVIHLFLARDLTQLDTPPPADDDEDMEVLLMEPAELDAALASGDEHSGDGDVRRPGPDHGHARLVDLLSHQLEGVHSSRGNDGGRALLIIVPDRDLHLLPQPVQNGETLWLGDVL
jgi:hypothetical protein